MALRRPLLVHLDLFILGFGGRIAPRRHVEVHFKLFRGALDRLFQMAPHGSRWYQMTPNGSRRVQMASDIAFWFRACLGEAFS